MKKSHIIMIVIAVIVLFGGSQTWSHHVKAKKLENRINAQLTANKSNYDNMWKSFKEVAQVTDLQAKQMKEVYTALIEGRNQDQNLLFKMVQEDNPQMSTEVYTKLQNQIIAGRKEFDNNQKQISDMVREYNDALVSYPFMTFITGKQPKNGDQYTIRSERTDGAFSTGQDDEVDLTGK